MKRCNHAGESVVCRTCEHAKPHDRVETWSATDDRRAEFCTEWGLCNAREGTVSVRCVEVREVTND